MKKIILSCIIVILLISNCLKVEAVENTGTDVIMNIVIPENSLSKNGYFDLLVKPGERQTLEIDVENISSEEKTVELQLANATTGDSGIVNYQSSDKKRDETLKLSFTDIAVINNKKIVLEPTSKKRVSLELLVPEKEFDGIILGGITAEESVEVEKKSNKNLGAGITNVFSFTIAAVLTQNKNSVINPNIELVKVEEGQVNYRNFILANLRNTEPQIIKHIDIESSVYNEQNERVYFSSSEDLSMAPHSNFNFGIDLQETEFIPGNYYIKMKAQIKDGELFEFSKEFVISKKKAQKLNKSAILKQNNKQNIWIYAVAGILSMYILINTFRSKRKKHIS